MSPRDERGVTLVELLIAVVILGVVVGAIGSSIIVGLRTTDETYTRLSESHDSQITTTYFVPDMQSASNVSLSDATCGGVTPVIRFRWIDEGVTKIASYSTRTASGERQLIRNYCEDGTLESTLIMAHNLSTAPPSVTCTPSCSATPARVVLTVNEASGTYSFQVAANRRTT